VPHTKEVTLAVWWSPTLLGSPPCALIKEAVEPPPGLPLGKRRPTGRPVEGGSFNPCLFMDFRQNGG